MWNKSIASRRSLLSLQLAETLQNKKFMPFSFDAFEAKNVNVYDEFPDVDGVDPKGTADVDGFSVVLFSCTWLST